MILEIVIIFGSIFIGLITSWYYQYFKHNAYYSKYNGPPPIPIVGNVYKIRSNADTIPVFTDYHKKYGPVIRMWFGFRPWIVIANDKAAEALLGSNIIINKAYTYKLFEPWLGTGLLTSSGAKWRRQRKILTPSFHFQILENYITIFNTHSDVLIQMLRKNVGTGTFDIYPYINLCALDIICETAMGIQIHAQEGEAKEYVSAVTEILDIILKRTFSPFTGYDFIFRLTKDYKKHKRALEILHGQTNYVIDCRQKELATVANVTDDVDGIVGSKRRLAFIDILLRCRIEGEPLSLENIREEVDTFMFEGHDTTTSGICFILYCLSQNLEIQDKVVQELRAIFNNDKYKIPTYQELQEMKYLEMVIKETLRLYPPVPMVSRTIPKNAEFGGTVFPEGSSIALFVYGLHRQEEMFPDPEKFDPERFTAENILKRSPYAYTPFSAGPRNCIGMRFAMLELKSAVSKILRNFEILPAPGYKPLLTLDGILHTTNGILLQLQERQF